MLYNKAIGATASAQKIYIESVFSTYLYTGNGSTQTITNGIDLSGKGGLVWIKNRSQYNHVLADTARGTGEVLFSNTTAGSTFSSADVTAFNANGFSLGANGRVNQNDVPNGGGTFVSWTFRKAAKFFDVVTATTTSTTATITHNLGSVPGAIIRKRIDSTSDWFVWHRSLSSGNLLYLNLTLAQDASSGISNVTSTSFDISGATGTYVFYIFAHDAGGFGDSGNDNVISCGSYTGNGSTSGPTVTLGWEPQWLLVKRAGGTGGSWFLFDSMRGIADGGDDTYLQANASDAEILANYVKVTSTGFAIESSAAVINSSGTTFVYIAIRRGPMKTPTDATKVFNAVTYTGTGTNSRVYTGAGFPLDAVLINDRLRTSGDSAFVDRLRGAAYLSTASTFSESTGGSFYASKLDSMDGYTGGTSDSTQLDGSGRTLVNYFFRRAPGFFDVVAYTGDGTSNRSLAHNLGVTPELIIVKSRNASASWRVWSASFADSSANLDLNGSGAPPFANNFFPATGRNNSNFIVNSSTNTNTTTFVAYLFASCAAVSKLGSYTGTGTTLSVNCGFTAGARFVLIKRIDNTGDWYVWDTARGIVAANDPFLLLNSTAAETTGTDYIDPLSTGFQISSTAPAAINASGGTYIYLSVA